MDDRPADDGVNRQLPHQKHALGRRAHAPQRPRHLHVSVPRGSSPRSSSRSCCSRCAATSSTCSACAWASRSLPSRGRSSAWRTASRTTGRRSPACAPCLASPKDQRIPPGMKATAEWFPANERGLRRRRLQHGRVGRLDARGANRRLGDHHAQLAVRVRADGRARARSGWRCGCSSITRPRRIPRSRPRSATTSSRDRRNTSTAAALDRRCPRSSVSATSGALPSRASSPIRRGAR